MCCADEINIYCRVGQQAAHGPHETLGENFLRPSFPGVFSVTQFNKDIVTV